MSPSKIAILHYAAPPTIGGVESTIAAHARLFADHGYNVHVITGSGEVFDPRVPVHVVPEAGSKSALVLEVNAQLAGGRVEDLFGTIVRDLRQQIAPLLSACSTVIVHNALSLHKNLALTAALDDLRRDNSFRLIAWCHDFAWTDPQYARDIHPGYPWSLLREPWADVDYVVVSDARRKELLSLWSSSGTRPSQEQSIRVVPPGIDPIEFLGIGAKTAEWLREFRLLEAAPLLILPARLTRRKRIEYALEITRELHDLGSAVKLMITGPPGPHNPANQAYLQQLDNQIKQLPKDTVLLLHKYGTVTRDMMRELYLLSDALLFPSEREGFGIPLLEAGLTRLNIFCSEIEPFREIAASRAHYLSAGMSPRAAAELIAHTLQGDSAYQFKRRVVDGYAWERIFSERIEPLIR